MEKTELPRTNRGFLRSHAEFKAAWRAAGCPRNFVFQDGVGMVLSEKEALLRERHLEMTERKARRLLAGRDPKKRRAELNRFLGR
jgi:hypothetical protein